MEMSILSPKNDEFYQLTEEDEKDYWSGEGHLVFRVLSYDPSAFPSSRYEIEVLDYSGCVSGLDEQISIDYAINDGILDVGKLTIGCTYEVHGITVVWTRGDGWTTDDDVDYYIKSVTRYAVLHQFIYAWWWHLVGWRIRNACSKTRTAFSKNR